MPTIGEALLEEANRKILTNFPLRDWQLEGAGEDFVPVEPERLICVEANDFMINIVDKKTASNVLWLELANGVLQVHVYDDAHDEPVTLRISRDDIEIDTTARD